MSLKEYAVSLALSLCNFSLDSSSDHLSGCQDISCIKDLTLLYESATVEDIYIAYEQLKIDENSLYSCIGIAGAQAGEEVIGEDIIL